MDAAPGQRRTTQAPVARIHRRHLAAPRANEHAIGVRPRPRPFRLRLATALLLTLLGPTLIPTAHAAEAWEEDGFLTTIIADERLDAGDEFGCHGMPGINARASPGDAATACRDYLTDRVAASRWSDVPRSFGAPSGLTADQHASLDRVGFTIHGDLTGLGTQAWYDGEDVPVRGEDWWDLGRRGGSLERTVADLDGLRTELEAGGLVNLYWEAQVADTNLRVDRDALDLLRDADVWFTTWGEAWSTWVWQGSTSPVLTRQNDTHWSLNAATNVSLHDARAWTVPLTWRIAVNGTDVIRVVGEDGVALPTQSADIRHLRAGWFEEDGVLHVTAPPDSQVTIVTDVPGTLDVAADQPRFFAGHTTAVTVAGHRVTDLWRWSHHFAEAPLRFTWLLQAREPIGGGWVLPVVAGGVAVASVAGMVWLVSQRAVTVERSAVEDDAGEAE